MQIKTDATFAFATILLYLLILLRLCGNVRLRQSVLTQNQQVVLTFDKLPQVSASGN